MTAKRTAWRAGTVFRSDSQADIWQGSYELVRNTGPKRWVCKRLPDPPETAEKIRAFWQAEKERGGMTAPIWDKTWAECAEGERPQQIGRLTHEAEAEREISARAARAGTEFTVTFISAAAYARYF